MVLALVLAAVFLVVIVLVVRGIVSKSLKLGTPTNSRFTKRQRLARGWKALAAIGCFSLIAAFSHRPTPYGSLIEAKGRVTRVVQVSERQSGNTAAAPTSINPFASHDWIELTVEPANDSGDMVWRIDTLVDEDVLAALKGETVTGKIVAVSAKTKCYELTTSGGNTLVHYDDIAVFERRSMMLFLAFGGAFLLGAVLLFVQERRTSPDAR